MSDYQDNKHEPSNEGGSRAFQEFLQEYGNVLNRGFSVSAEIVPKRLVGPDWKIQRELVAVVKFGPDEAVWSPYASIEVPAKDVYEFMGAALDYQEMILNV